MAAIALRQVAVSLDFQFFDSASCDLFSSDPSRKNSRAFLSFASSVAFCFSRVSLLSNTMVFSFVVCPVLFSKAASGEPPGRRKRPFIRVSSENPVHLPCWIDFPSLLR
jgi:hypothetical protein